jgi:hypothetical protein
MPVETFWGEYPHRVVSNRPVTPVIRELWPAPRAATRANFRYLLTLTREPGARLDARIPELLPHCVGDLRGPEIFASGSTAFVIHCAVAAVALGADPTAVHTEGFFTEQQPWTGHPPAAPEDLATNAHARDRLTPDLSLVTPTMTARVEGLIDQLVAEWSDDQAVHLHIRCTSSGERSQRHAGQVFG